MVDNNVIPNWKKSLPNLITVSRIVIVPFVVFSLQMDSPVGGYIASLLFIVASITDYFDGSLARKYKVESVIGKFLDPVADKILVSSTLIMMIPSGRLGPEMVIVLLARDTLISGLRSIAASQNIIISAGTMGKWKTAIQMIAIPAVLIKEPVFDIPLYEIGLYTLWLSVALSVWSGAEYCYKFLKK